MKLGHRGEAISLLSCVTELNLEILKMSWYKKSKRRDFIYVAIGNYRTR
jgi:hypothetical protein